MRSWVRSWLRGWLCGFVRLASRDSRFSRFSRNCPPGLSAPRIRPPRQFRRLQEWKMNAGAFSADVFFSEFLPVFVFHPIKSKQEQPHRTKTVDGQQLYRKAIRLDNALKRPGQSKIETLYSEIACETAPIVSQAL